LWPEPGKGHARAFLLPGRTTLEFNPNGPATPRTEGMMAIVETSQLPVFCNYEPASICTAPIPPPDATGLVVRDAIALRDGGEALGLCPRWLGLTEAIAQGQRQPFDPLLRALDGIGDDSDEHAALWRGRASFGRREFESARVEFARVSRAGGALGTQGAA